MRALLLVLAVLLCPALAAAQEADTLSAAQIRQRATWADQRAARAMAELDVLRMHLERITSRGLAPTFRVTFPTDSGWAYIEVRQPGARSAVQRDSVWVR